MLISEFQRIEDIQTAKELAGLKNVTIEQAEVAIENIIGQAHDIETEVKTDESGCHHRFG